MRTVDGLVRVDVIYRRVDDLFLDPEVFRPDSTLGVPGLMRAWRAGNVAIANAPGAGVADDKVVYAYVPDLIRYYLDEEPHRSPTCRPTVCARRRRAPATCSPTCDELVVKPANESGGYGIFIGPQATDEPRLTSVRRRDRGRPPQLRGPAHPRSCRPRRRSATAAWRPATSTCGRSSSPGEQPYVTNGGLTRVALREGSLVVNSSQGGGSKDTWIVEPERRRARTPSSKPPAPDRRPMLLCRTSRTTLYWAGRYLERAEDTGPHRPEHTDLLVDLPPSVAADVGAAARHPRAPTTSSGDPLPTRADELSIIEFLIADRTTTRAAWCRAIAQARENLRIDPPGAPPRGVGGRQRPPPLGRLDHAEGVSRRGAGATGCCDRVISDCQRIAGVIVGTMSRDARLRLPPPGHATSNGPT